MSLRATEEQIHTLEQLFDGMITDIDKGSRNITNLSCISTMTSSIPVMVKMLE